MSTAHQTKTPRRAAEEPLPGRVPMEVDAEAYAEFVKRLDQPAKPNERLRRTMQSEAPWRAV